VPCDYLGLAIRTCNHVFAFLTGFSWLLYCECSNEWIWEEEKIYETMNGNNYNASHSVFILMDTNFNEF